MSELQEQIEHIIQQKALGRSKRYEQLLIYLGERAILDDPPTELEIALNVFSKGDGFDPNVDTVVRVYAHNLRKKLKNYYSDPKTTDELVITLPPGAYKLEYGSDEEFGDSLNNRVASSLLKPKLLTWRSLALFSLSLCMLLIGFIAIGVRDTSAPMDNAAQTLPSFWSSIIEDERDTIIVYGDLVTYILSESGTDREFTLRDYDVNSEDDFVSHALNVEGFEPVWEDDSIVSKSEIHSVHLISQMLAPHITTSIISSSELTPSMVRDHNIIYIGNLKALRLLNSFFQGSSFSLTENKRYLVHKTTGETLRPHRQSFPKQDYALLAKFDGPSGGQVVLLGGNIAEGVLALGMLTSTKSVLDGIIAEHFSGDIPAQNFEILISAYGLTEGSYTSHEVLSVYELNPADIWSSQCDSDCEKQLNSVTSD